MSLPTSDFADFWCFAARSNYLAADRIDLQLAPKEVCRFMSAPNDADVRGRHEAPRALPLGAQETGTSMDLPMPRAEGVDVYNDTDWFGRPRTRHSTSGGCVVIGQHCIRSWSSTQPSVTLSSGEAEFYGLVKAAGAGLGHQSLRYGS